MEPEAKEFATFWHGSIDQRRKYTNEPYINHPEAVANLVRNVPHTEAMICAAWLHDVVEDTPCTTDEVRIAFGLEVAALVEMLTDVSKPGDVNRKARKAIDRDHTAKASPQAKTIKLADLIDNSRSIVEFDKAFAKVYLAEKVLLLEVLQEGDATLMSVAREFLTANAK